MNRETNTFCKLNFIRECIFPNKNIFEIYRQKQTHLIIEFTGNIHAFRILCHTSVTKIIIIKHNIMEYSH